MCQEAEVTWRLDSLWADSLLEATTVMTEVIVEVAGVEEGLALQKDTYSGLARLAATRLAATDMGMAQAHMAAAAAAGYGYGYGYGYGGPWGGPYGGYGRW